MSAGVFTTAPTNSTAPLFKAWVSALKASILACGWVQTSDTGQLVVDSLVVPTVTNTPSGYFMFAMGDSLQASYPCYMRIDVGSGSAAASPLVWTQVGTATDGAGNLGGITTTKRPLALLYAGVETPMASYYSGSTSRFVACLWIGTGTNNANGYYGAIISVERSHNGSGVDTSDGLLVFTSDCTGIGEQIYGCYLGYSLATQPPEFRHWNSTMPITGTGAVGNAVNLYPVRVWAPGETCPSLNLLMYFVSDMASQNAVSATLWSGNTRTVMPLGYARSSTYYVYGGGAGPTSVAMVYE